MVEVQALSDLVHEIHETFLFAFICMKQTPKYYSGLPVYLVD